MSNIPKSKKRQCVADGVFFAELDELLSRTLREEGYSGVEIRKTPLKTEIVIRATRTQEVIGENGRRINELTSIIQKRFGFDDKRLEIYAEQVANRGLCALTQTESLKYKLLRGLPIRRAAYAIIRNVMEAGAKGCEVIVSGKLRQQRANVMKFKEGYMIKTGHACVDYVDEAVRHVQIKAGMLGVKVRVMKPHDPRGKDGPAKLLPDVITVHEPKEDEKVEWMPNKADFAQEAAAAVEVEEAKEM